MSDSLLPYYNRELVAIRKLAAEFAEAHPKIAGRLRLAADAVDDPHVARLLEGTAFLAARVHRRMDDEFPEFTDALLGVLYPHYLAPVPSCAVAQFASQPDLLTPVHLPPGLALDAEPVRSEVCRFRTTAPVTLWPIEIESIRLSGLPLAAPPNPLATGAVSVLRIVLKCTSVETTFSRLGLDRLRFFLRGAANISLPLLEMLSTNAVSVAYADSTTDTRPAVLPAAAIAPVGFADDEALLPWPARSFSGFRLLTEYFAFPEKFLFFDLLNIENKTLLETGNRMEIFIYFNRAVPELERAVGIDALALGCTPVVNLFQQRCEPLALSHTDTEYRVVPDARRPAALEIWQIARVRETRPDATQRPWRPFYRMTHGDPEAGVVGGFYHVTRRDSPAPLNGTEVFLAPDDPEFDANRPADTVLSIDALCLNRDLPALLPFGGGHPRLRLVEPSAVVARITCLTPPTPTLRAPLREQGFWRLISHLSLGHLSVVGGEAGAKALQEMLRLYDFRDSAETRAAIDALVSVSAQPGTARVPGARYGAFCRGLDVTLEFEPRTWQAGGLYVLASVLDRFLALHATVNSFVRTRVKLRGRPENLKTWPARAGARALL
jgi:type VI secretion system protein ImpG